MNIHKSFITLIIVIVVFSNYCFSQTSQKLYVKPEKENFRESPNGEKIGELIQGTELDIIRKEGNWVQVLVKGWIYEPSTTAEKTIKPKPLKTDPAVEFVNFKIEKYPEDYSRDKPYRAHVRAYFQFKNNSDKVVLGIEFDADFLDSFGDLLYQTTFKDQVNIPPNEMNAMDSYWYWEDGYGSPYSKLKSAAGAGTIKVNVKIKRVAFKDGTIENY